MKQATISNFFMKRSVTATDELLRPAKKFKSDDKDDNKPSNANNNSDSKKLDLPKTPNSTKSTTNTTTSSKPTPQSDKKPLPQQVTQLKDEEDGTATPPLSPSTPSPATSPQKKVSFTDGNDTEEDNGNDTEEDEDSYTSRRTITKRSQSMPSEALKAAAKMNNDSSDADSDVDVKKVRDDSSTAPLKALNGSNNSAKSPKVDKSRSTVRFQHKLPSGQTVQIRQGDITEEHVGAIVNAANSSLAHGGGVAGAISRKGGPQIQSESSKWVSQNGRVDPGKVAVTGPGKLPCVAVIHAVGPIWAGGKRDEDKQLFGAVYNSFLKAHQMNLDSISVPAISSGIFGFPKDRCAYILTECAVKFTSKYPASSLREIRFTNFDNETVEIFTEEFENRFKQSEDEEENDENDNSKVNATHPPKNKTLAKVSHVAPSSPLKKSTKVDDVDSGDETEEDTNLLNKSASHFSDSD